MPDRRPSRGEVWMMDLDPTRGREQAGTMPVLILSVDALNHGPADLVIVMPVTSKDKRIATHVRVDPPEGGLAKPSFVMTEAIRSVSPQRLKRFLGVIDAETLASVEDRIKILLGLP